MKLYRTIRLDEDAPQIIERTSHVFSGYKLILDNQVSKWGGRWPPLIEGEGLGNFDAVDRYMERACNAAQKHDVRLMVQLYMPHQVSWKNHPYYPLAGQWWQKWDGMLNAPEVRQALEFRYIHFLNRWGEDFVSSWVICEELHEKQNPFIIWARSLIRHEFLPHAPLAVCCRSDIGDHTWAQWNTDLVHLESRFVVPFGFRSLEDRINLLIKQNQMLQKKVPHDAEIWDTEPCGWPDGWWRWINWGTRPTVVSQDELDQHTLDVLDLYTGFGYTGIVFWMPTPGQMEILEQRNK